MREITLKYFRVPGSWEVASIKNSALLNPGDWINKDYRDKLVQAAQLTPPIWDVTIIEPNLGAITNAVGTVASMVPPLVLMADKLEGERLNRANNPMAPPGNINLDC